jgi:hypothetical protein
MDNTTDFTTRIQKLMNSLTIKGRKTALVQAYCEYFAFKRDSFYRRLRGKIMSCEEMNFLEKYFRENIPGGEKILDQIS